MEDENVDTIINLCNHNVHFARPVSPFVKYLEGTSYAIVRSEFRRLPPKEITSAGGGPNLVISFGGSDPCHHTISVIRNLDEIIQGSWNITLIIGPHFTDKQDIIKAVKSSGLEISIIEEPANIANIFHKADLCICGSGTTVLEMAALGTPAVIVPQSAAEMNFSRIFESTGFAKVIGSPKGISQEKLKEALTYFSDPDNRGMAGKAGIQLCDGNGEERIINEINCFLS